MNIEILKGSNRHDIIRLLPDKDHLVGIELGVAGGGFSKRMLDSNKFEHFFGIDMYADHHDVEEYKNALRLTGLFSSYKLLRMSFDDAFDLFEDQSIDFIYVDGYAHTGEEGGDTIYKWYQKLKVGGTLAGDDYHNDWPLVVEAVNTFATQVGGKLYVTERVEDINFCKYPSCGLIKESHQVVHAPAKLVAKGKLRAEKRKRRWARKRFMREYVVPSLKSLFRLN